MKLKLFNKTKYISNIIPINLYATITKQKVILPFYHAVSNNPKPHLKHLNYYRRKVDFEEDLSFFLRHYDNISTEAIKQTNKMSFHISFDDGLSEVYEEIIPILQNKKIDATFFINTDFIDNKNLFYRHKISIILDDISNSKYSLDKTSTFLSCNDDKIFDKINRIKDEKIINQVANLLKIDFEEYLNNSKPYLTTKQLIKINKMGYTIGNHSKSHFNFRDISFIEQKKQISKVNNFLNKELNVKNLYFSFPFGDEKIKSNFFDYMYNEENIHYSFGISGMKKDEFARHLHRIPMEYYGFSAEEIIKFEYFYFMIKAFFNKNKLKR